MSNNLIALQNKFLGQGQTIYDVLSRLHDEQGHVSDEDIARLAETHELPPAHVRSVAKFYDDLTRTGPAKRTLKVCNGEACRAAGCDALIDRVTGALGVGFGQIDGNGNRVEHVACLGYCGLGPMAMVDDTPVRLDSKRAEAAVLSDLGGGAAHGLAEPQNPVFLPAGDAPCILLRHMGPEHAGGLTELDAARAAGVYGALQRAVEAGQPEVVLEQIERSQLRGRGGAGFPTGRKLRTVKDSSAPDGSGRKFVVVNFDERDAGSYIDKELVERDPHTQIEGILLAAYAVGARHAYIYARMEYPRARRILAEAIEHARVAGLIGAPLFGSDFACEVEIVKGQGAYICGEETSLLRSIEGVPGLVSIRPPFPAQQGLWRCPTAVNNVETLHNLPWIVQHGGEAYAAIGHGRSRGTKAVSLNHRVARPGVYEVPFGITLRELIFDLAGGMADGQRFKAVQVGGPLGGILPESKLDTPLDFEAMAAEGAIVGHAGVVVYGHDDDLIRIARGLMHFCAVESCGKCFPCRIGAVRGTELLDQMMADGPSPARVSLLEELLETMEFGSLCAMGGMTPAPIQTILKYFPEELERYASAGDKAC